VVEKFKKWKAELKSRVTVLPFEFICMVAVFMEERIGTLSEAVGSLQDVLGLSNSEMFVTCDLLRETILKVSTRKQYGIKPFHSYNEYEQADVDDLRFV